MSQHCPGCPYYLKSRPADAVGDVRAFTISPCPGCDHEAELTTLRNIVMERDHRHKLLEEADAEIASLRIKGRTKDLSGCLRCNGFGTVVLGHEDHESAMRMACPDCQGSGKAGETEMSKLRADLGQCREALDDIRGEADSEKPDRDPEVQLTYIVNRAEEAISPYPAPTTPGPAEEASEEGRE